MSHRAVRLSAVGAMWIILFAVGMFYGRPAGAESPQVIDVKPSPAADERLFLVAAAKRIYLTIIDVKSTDLDAELKEMQELAKVARQKAVRLKVHIEHERLDSELVQVYQDLVDTADARIECATQLEKIIRVAKGEGDRDAAEVLGKGFETGVGAAAGAAQAGAEDGDAAAAGLIVGLFRAAIEADRRAKQLREQACAAEERAIKAMEDRDSLSKARLQDTTAVLTKRYGWKPKETGIAGDARFEEMPRNPIGQVNICRGWLADNDPDKVRIAALACEQAVRLVPEGQLYDEYRLYCLESAGQLLFRSVFIREKPKGVFRGVRNADAAHAAALYDACLKYSADPAGALRSNKAWMLATDNQMDDALKLAAEVSKLQSSDAGFAYWEACLLSATGNTDLSFDWLNHAVRKLGFADIPFAKTDPDLARMRKVRQKDFDDLVAVRSTSRVKFGFFNDDFVLTNNSAFAITNVRVQAILVQGDRVWNLDLKTDRIGPGADHLWEDVMSVPGSRLDDSSCLVIVTCQEQ